MSAATLEALFAAMSQPSDQDEETQSWMPRGTQATSKPSSSIDQRIHHENSLFHHHKSDVEEMVQAAQLKEHEVVLDLGCGIGWGVQLAAKQCRFVVGADLDKALLLAASQEIERLFQQVNKPNWVFVKFDMSATAAVYQKLGTTTATAMGAAASTPRQFDVILLCWTVHHIQEHRRAPILQRLRETILKPNGRIILDQQAPNLHMRTIELSWGVEDTETGQVKEWNSWRREKVGNKVGVKDARRCLQKLAESAGFMLQAHEPFPNTERAGYTDRTQEISHTARADNPGVGQVDDTMLEVARKKRMRSLEVEDFPQTEIYLQHIGRGLHWAARHKVASEMGVLVPQA